MGVVYACIIVTFAALDAGHKVCIFDVHMETVVARSEDIHTLHTGASPPLFVTEINVVHKTS